MVAGIVSGRLALVTGAGSGIGRAACQVLSREGATVIAADKNYQSAVETIKKHTALASGTNAVGDHCAFELDVSNTKSILDLFTKLQRQYKAPPTIIINSAGITRDNWLLKLSEDDFNSVHDVNLKGTFLIMQTFAKALTEASLPGSIVNISSIVGKYGNMGQANYSASKAGVVGMTKTAAKELGKFNIRDDILAIFSSHDELRIVETGIVYAIEGGMCSPLQSKVNAILPGFIDTPMVKTVPEKVKEGMLKKIPLGRLGDPTEVAEVITFLSSDKSSYITGTTVEVTGGF